VKRIVAFFIVSNVLFFLKGFGQPGMEYDLKKPPNTKTVPWAMRNQMKPSGATQERWFRIPSPITIFTTISIRS